MRKVKRRIANGGMRKLGNWSLEKESVQMYLTDLARGYEEGNTGETDNKDTKKNK